MIVMFSAADSSRARGTSSGAHGILVTRVDRLSAFVKSQAVEGVYEVIDVVDE
jgi:hypothetical protein